MNQHIEIISAVSTNHMAIAHDLFKEYAASIGVDLSFQGFTEEIEGLPGRYSPPKGGLFLAILGDQAAGCVAFRPLDAPAIAELKRLYVRPGYRGHGLGLVLTDHAIHRARDAGYDRIRLDTLPSMHSARELYHRMGFQEIPAYTFNPIPGTSFMELDIRRNAGVVGP